MENNEMKNGSEIERNELQNLKIIIILVILIIKMPANILGNRNFLLNLLEEYFFFLSGVG